MTDPINTPAPQPSTPGPSRHDLAEPAVPAVPSGRTEDLPPAARRALAEAEARRAAAAEAPPPAERAGRGGLEPVRYGDWEIKGLAADF